MFVPLLFLLFLIAVVVQCGFAFFFFGQASRFPEAPAGQPAVMPVSVVICARDEARNLERHLPGILAQRYTNEDGKPDFEVIVVNDCSEDDTEDVLYRLEQRYQHLWHVTISKSEARLFPGKKFPLSRGVTHASHQVLLLTDADCAPASPNWISRMVQPFARGKKIVAGYSGFHCRKGLLNSFIRWETMHTFLQYAAYTLAGRPYMAVGRNLACTRQIFLDAQRSEAWSRLPSGDDDLLVQACGDGTNMTVVAHKDAFTFSEAPANVPAFIGQKQRHTSTAKYYKMSTLLLLGAYVFSHALVWLLLLPLLFTAYWKPVLVFFSIRCLAYWIVWGLTSCKLNEKIPVLRMLACDFGWMIYNFAISPYAFWKNKKQWR